MLGYLDKTFPGTMRRFSPSPTAWHDYMLKDLARNLTPHKIRSPTKLNTHSQAGSPLAMHGVNSKITQPPKSVLSAR